MKSYFELTHLFNSTISPASASNIHIKPLYRKFVFNFIDDCFTHYFYTNESGGGILRLQEITQRMRELLTPHLLIGGIEELENSIETTIAKFIKNDGLNNHGIYNVKISGNYAAIELLGDARAPVTNLKSCIPKRQLPIKGGVVKVGKYPIRTADKQQIHLTILNNNRPIVREIISNSRSTDIDTFKFRKLVSYVSSLPKRTRTENFVSYHLNQQLRTYKYLNLIDLLKTIPSVSHEVKLYREQLINKEIGNNKPTLRTKFTTQRRAGNTPDIIKFVNDLATNTLAEATIKSRLEQMLMRRRYSSIEDLLNEIPDNDPDITNIKHKLLRSVRVVDIRRPNRRLTYSSGDGLNLDLDFKDPDS